MEWIDKLFKLENINGDGMVNTYLHRWTLLKIGKYKIYLHHFLDDEWSKFPHDHPKKFISIGIWGSYEEEVYHIPSDYRYEFTKYTFRAPWIRSFSPTHAHRIINPKNCWTICIVGKSERIWGFWYKYKFWIPWNIYVELVHKLKDLNDNLPEEYKREEY